jgi:hypothetical protein
MSKLAEELVDDLSKLMVKDLKLDKKTGEGEATDGFFDKYSTNDEVKKFVDFDITPKSIKAHEECNSVIIAASTKAFGIQSVEAMNANNDIERTSIEIPMGHKNNLSITMDRSKEYNNHLTGNNEKTVKYGVITAAYEVKGGKQTSGVLKKVRHEIAELALSKLK